VLLFHGRNAYIIAVPRLTPWVLLGHRRCETGGVGRPRTKQARALGLGLQSPKSSLHSTHWSGHQHSSFASVYRVRRQSAAFRVNTAPIAIHTPTTPSQTPPRHCILPHTRRTTSLSLCHLSLPVPATCIFADQNRHHRATPPSTPLKLSMKGTLCIFRQRPYRRPS
jgi:hypothetical protein